MKENKNIPPPKQNSSFFSTLKDGFSLGAGSSLGHSVINYFTTKNTKTKEDECKILREKYELLCHNSELENDYKCKEIFNKFYDCVLNK